MPESIDRHRRRTFHPALAQTLAVALLLPLLATLGYWQMQRAREKQVLFNAVAAATHAPVQQVTSLPHSPLPQHAWADGRFDRHFFLLDNRVAGGRAGYELLAPLRLADGRAVLINRGWLPPGPDRAHPPTAALPATTVRVQGLALIPAAPAFTLSAREAMTAGWPKVVQTAQPATLASALGYPLLPVVIYPDGSAVAAHELAALHTFGPGRHRAYAVQWFVMAALLLLFYLRHGLRRGAAR